MGRMLTCNLQLKQKQSQVVLNTLLQLETGAKLIKLELGQVSHR